MCVRNGKATLARAVESIRQQTLGAWEYIIVNDGSSDGTTALLHDYAQQDSRIRVITLPPTGIPGALNAGLPHCQAPYLARMDADDYSYPTRLQKQVEYLEAHPEIDIVSSHVRHAGDPDTQQGYARHIDWLNGLITPEEHYRARFQDQPLANPAALLRRSVFEQVGPYAEGDFPEDYEFWLRCLHAGHRMAKLPEVLLDWNDLPTRATRTLDMYQDLAFHKVKADYWARWAQRRWGAANALPLYIWGTGKHVRRKSATIMEQGWPPTGYIDVTDREVYRGKPVMHYTQLGQLTPPFHVLVYVAQREAKAEILQYVEKLGWTAGHEYTMMV